MDLTYKKICDAATLTQNLIDLGLLQGSRFFGVSSDEQLELTVVHASDDLTDNEKFLITTAVEGYDNLTVVRSNKLGELHAACTDYIYQHYDQARQSSLNAMLTEGAIMGWTNRIGYIASALGWIKTVITYYYTKQDEINSKTTAEDINGVVWNFSGFDASDPEISLRQAQALID